MKALLPTFLACFLLSLALCSPAAAQAVPIDSRLPQPNQGFYGLDGQSISPGEQKSYTISLPENASHLFAGVLAREGSVSLSLRNSSQSFPSSGGSAVAENAQAGVYTVAVTGSGKYAVFWDYMGQDSYVPSSPSGPLGSKTNPVLLVDPVPAIYAYGFQLDSNHEYTISMGGVVWFKADPSLIPGLPTPANLKFRFLDYTPYEATVKAEIFVVDRQTGVESPSGLSPLDVGQTGWTTNSYNPNNYYLISLTENGVKDQSITITWKPLENAQGAYSQQVAGAIKANDPFNLNGGAVFGVPIARGSTTYFLIDPKGFGIPWTKSTYIVLIQDLNTINPATFDLKVLELDANNNLLFTWQPQSESSGMYNLFLKDFTLDDYNSGVKYLLKATETGTKSTTMNVKWW